MNQSRTRSFTYYSVQIKCLLFKLALSVRCEIGILAERLLLS